MQKGCLAWRESRLRLRLVSALLSFQATVSFQQHLHSPITNCTKPRCFSSCFFWRFELFLMQTYPRALRVSISVTKFWAAESISSHHFSSMKFGLCFKPFALSDFVGHGPWGEQSISRRWESGDVHITHAMLGCSPWPMETFRLDPFGTDRRQEGSSGETH